VLASSQLVGLLLADSQFMKRINGASQMLTTLVRVHQSCVLLWVWVRVRYRCFIDLMFPPCANGRCPRIVIRKRRVFAEIGVVRWYAHGK
jgi:hypothetical protein